MFNFLLLPLRHLSSVVITSVSDRRTLPDLHPIYGLQVTTLWVYCPRWVSQLVELNLPSLGLIIGLQRWNPLYSRPGLKGPAPESLYAGMAAALNAASRYSLKR